MSSVQKVASSEVAVAAVNLTLEFAAKEQAALTVLKDLNVEIEKGEFVSLLGPSGCGKSTFLNAVAGLIEPSRGQIFVGGSPLSDLNKKAAYMFQEDTLLPWANALQNVSLPMEIARRPDKSEAARLLELVGLRGFEDRKPRELSGGMRKRVQFARLLAQDPEMMLMDEPFGALDALTKLVMQQELLRVWDLNPKTVLFVTHDPGEAILLSDRMLVFGPRPGRIVADYRVPIGRPRENLAAIMKTDVYRDLYDELVNKLMSMNAHDFRL